MKEIIKLGINHVTVTVRDKPTTAAEIKKNQVLRHESNVAAYSLKKETKDIRAAEKMWAIQVYWLVHALIENYTSFSELCAVKNQEDFYSKKGLITILATLIDKLNEKDSRQTIIDLLVPDLKKEKIAPKEKSEDKRTPRVFIQAENSITFARQRAQQVYLYIPEKNFDDYMVVIQEIASAEAAIASQEKIATVTICNT